MAKTTVRKTGEMGMWMLNMQSNEEKLPVWSIKSPKINNIEIPNIRCFPNLHPFVLFKLFGYSMLVHSNTKKIHMANYNREPCWREEWNGTFGTFFLLLVTVKAHSLVKS